MYGHKTSENPQQPSKEVTSTVARLLKRYESSKDWSERSLCLRIISELLAHNSFPAVSYLSNPIKLNLIRISTWSIMRQISCSLNSNIARKFYLFSTKNQSWYHNELYHNFTYS